MYIHIDICLLALEENHIAICPARPPSVSCCPWPSWLKARATLDSKGRAPSGASSRKPRAVHDLPLSLMPLALPDPQVQCAPATCISSVKPFGAEVFRHLCRWVPSGVPGKQARRSAIVTHALRGGRGERLLPWSLANSRCVRAGRTPPCGAFRGSPNGAR